MRKNTILFYLAKKKKKKKDIYSNYFNILTWRFSCSFFFLIQNEADPIRRQVEASMRKPHPNSHFFFDDSSLFRLQGFPFLLFQVPINMMFLVQILVLLTNCVTLSSYFLLSPSFFEYKRGVIHIVIIKLRQTIRAKLIVLSLAQISYQ